ncbi:GNAT family N-acetyltransferase, partial [Streptomyces huiliensis]|uniref:GNAT family N-acetyltransferase n=1 Tax=Streptomyces huiliensis TaxID=2876027 RepID=UPI0027E1C483
MNGFTGYGARGDGSGRGTPGPGPSPVVRIEPSPVVRIEPWTDGPVGLDLLRRCNAPEMTAHLGGPESEERLVDRHRRYTALSAGGPGRMFRVVLPDGTPVGTTGYWECAWRDEPAYEAGWGILPAYQGRGLAAAAVAAVIAEARTAPRHRFLYAFPAVANGPSNAVCRKAGFSLLGEADIEYPKGTFRRGGVWRLDLAGPPPGGPGG